MDSADNFIETIPAKKRGRPKKQTSDDASPFGPTTYPGPFPDHFMTMTDEQVEETYEEYGIELPTPLKVFDDDGESTLHPLTGEPIDPAKSEASSRRAILAAHVVSLWVDTLTPKTLVAELESISRRTMSASEIRYAKEGRVEAELTDLIYAKLMMEAPRQQQQKETNP